MDIITQRYMQILKPIANDDETLFKEPKIATPKAHPIKPLVKNNPIAVLFLF